MRHHDDTPTTPRSVGPGGAGEPPQDVHERIREARATAEAAMEDRREAVRAEFEERVRELGAEQPTGKRPSAA